MADRRLQDLGDEQPTPQCLQRIQHDLAELNANPPPGVFVSTEENDMTLLHAVIVGSWGTPIEGGFFRLVLKFPHDYPSRPPRVRFLTGVGKASFSGHIYGELVCLSVLGTAPGPGWNPAMNIGSLLVSIQSFLADGASERMRYNTVSIAVCDTLEDCLQNTDSPSVSPALSKQMLKYFADNYAKYEGAVEAQICSPGAFSWFKNIMIGDYEPLLKRLRDIKKKIDDQNTTAQ
ncbi:ubiquitin-conjugating enzyme E2 Z [Rhipicephalus microplus]|uniref:ubiquitin-conjugating enzyme E2 Z n=1 Tax=Rhipicephalus microplus TaxID=6941 RepID=UPI003F6BB0D9